MFATTQPSNSVLDRQSLLMRCMGNVEFAQRVLESFARQLDSDLAALESAIANQNLHQILEISHRVRGTSSNVSACRIHALATQIGELAKRAEADTLPLYAVSIRKEQEAFLEESRSIRVDIQRHAEVSADEKG